MDGKPQWLRDRQIQRRRRRRLAAAIMLATCCGTVGYLFGPVPGILCLASGGAFFLAAL